MNATKKVVKKPAAKPAKKAAAKPAKKAAARPSGKRRFEFSEGSSNKFWEIQVSGEGFTTRARRSRLYPRATFSR